MWGIAMVSGVGAVGVLGEDETRRHRSSALTDGAGLALIVDEFALLLDVQDVYWAKQGRVSVDIGVGLVAAGGTTFSAIPILRRLARTAAAERRWCYAVNEPGGLSDGPRTVEACE